MWIKYGTSHYRARTTKQAVANSNTHWIYWNWTSNWTNDTEKDECGSTAVQQPQSKHKCLTWAPTIHTTSWRLFEWRSQREEITNLSTHKYPETMISGAPISPHTLWSPQHNTTGNGEWLIKILSANMFYLKVLNQTAVLLDESCCGEQWSLQSALVAHMQSLLQCHRYRCV